MKRVAWLVVIAIVMGAALVVWRRHGTVSESAEPAKPSSTAPTATAAQELPALDHEQRETDSVTKLTQQLALSETETSDVLASLKELQDGRRKLFDDLAAKRITTDDVSAGLHQLRAHMRDRIEATLGNNRGQKLLEQIRDEHR
jgi:hypothetical protein